MLRSILIVGATLLSLTAVAAPDKVVPFDGVIDKNGTPFSGIAEMNFALYACSSTANPSCSPTQTPIWVAKGAVGDFASAGNSASGINVTANGGRFSVLLGDTSVNSQLALVPDVWRTNQLHVRVAIKSSSGWVVLTGFQRIAGVASALSAEEAASFTVRQNLTVAGSATVGGTATVTGATTVGSLNSRGAADVDTTLNVDGASTFGGTATFNNTVALTAKQLFLKSQGDLVHGLQAKSTWAGAGLDGPVLWGFNGGALGTAGAGERAALRWDISNNVVVGGTLNAGAYNKGGEPLYIICSASRNENHPGFGPHDLTFTNDECGGQASLLFNNNYVGVLAQMAICPNATGETSNEFHSVVIRPGQQNVNFPDVRWRGTACGQGTYKISVIYFRK